MNAPVKVPLAASRARTATEQAEAILVWIDDNVALATDFSLSREDYEGRAGAALEAAQRYTAAAADETDLDVKLMWLTLVGRYALRARVCRARAIELRG